MNKESLGKFYKKYRLFIFPAAVVVSCLILLTFVLIPQIGVFLKNSRLEQDFRTRSEFLNTKVEALEGLDEDSLRRQVSYVLSSLPGEKDFAGTIILLQNIANENGFVITALSLGAGSGNKSSTGQSFGARLEAVGAKNLLGRFLSSIESSPRLMRVTNIEVSSGRGGDIVDANLAIEAMFTPIPANLGSIDSPLPQISSGEEELISKLARTEVSTAVPLTVTGKADPFE